MSPASSRLSPPVPGHRARLVPGSGARPAILACFLLALFSAPLYSQYEIEAPSGLELEFSSTDVRAMLDTTRSLEMNLQEDPRVLYFTIVGAEVPSDSATPAYPWNAIEVRNDSVATILTPGNLREGDRAYYNYAVIRMKMVRELDPDVPCEELMEREVEAVSAFADGWLSSRLLFGGLPFAPLDEIAFAREQGLLAGMIAAKADRQLGVCADEWASSHVGAVEAYVSWRDTRFLEIVDLPPEQPADSVPPIEAERG